MKEKLGILVSAGRRRKDDLVAGVLHWCEAQGVDHVLLSDDRPIDEQTVATLKAVYKPLTLGSFDRLGELPPEIPLILDYAVPFVPGEQQRLKRAATGRRVALRNAFCVPFPDSDLQVECQVPFMAAPLKPSDEPVRDVIVVDAKQFHRMATHGTILSLVAEICERYPKLCEIAGTELKIYFTSFMPVSVYRDAIQVFAGHREIGGVPQNWIDQVGEAVIPPAARMEDYRRLLRRARLFITEHGDIADVDLLHVGTLGVPIMTYSRRPFAITAGIQHLAREAAIAIDPRHRQLLRMAENQRMRPEWGPGRVFRVDRVEPWDYAVLNKIFLSSWDILWEWALSGRVNRAVNEAMAKPRKWNLGVRTVSTGYDQVATRSPAAIDSSER